MRYPLQAVIDFEERSLRVFNCRISVAFHRNSLEVSVADRSTPQGTVNYWCRGDWFRTNPQSS